MPNPPQPERAYGHSRAEQTTQTYEKRLFFEGHSHLEIRAKLRDFVLFVLIVMLLMPHLVDEAEAFEEIDELCATAAEVSGVEMDTSEIVVDCLSEMSDDDEWVFPWEQAGERPPVMLDFGAAEATLILTISPASTPTTIRPDIGDFSANLGRIKPGEVAELLNREPTEDARGNLWFHVKYGDVTGWILMRDFELGEHEGPVGPEPSGPDRTETGNTLPEQADGEGGKSAYDEAVAVFRDSINDNEADISLLGEGVAFDPNENLFYRLTTDGAREYWLPFTANDHLDIESGWMNPQFEVVNPTTGHRLVIYINTDRMANRQDAYRVTAVRPAVSLEAAQAEFIRWDNAHGQTLPQGTVLHITFIANNPQNSNPDVGQKITGDYSLGISELSPQVYHIRIFDKSVEQHDLINSIRIADALTLISSGQWNSVTNYFRELYPQGRPSPLQVANREALTGEDIRFVDMVIS